MFEPIDLVAHGDEGLPVGDADNGLIGVMLKEPLHDLHFCLIIHSRGEFIQQKDGRVGEEGSGQCNSLHLSKRDAKAAFADDCLKTMIQAGNKGFQASCVEGELKG